MSVALAGLGGCTLDAVPPQIDAVAPGWGYNGETTAVEIRGSNFFPTVIVSETSEEGGRLEGAFQAWLEGPDTVALEAVHHTSYGKIGAVVPADLPVGSYDLRVEVPTGLDTVLEGAFTVTDTRADHLQFSVVTVGYTAGDIAQVFLSLRDPADSALAQDLEVEVTALSSTGAIGVVFSEGDLVNQQGLTEGRGVRGSLGEDGSATLLMTSEIADDVEFLALPADDTSVVRGDSLQLSWEPGAVQEVELTLPEEGFAATAGQPFSLGIRLLDGLGNVLSTEPADLLFSDHCLSSVDPVVSIVGQADIEVTLTQACDTDYLAVYAYDRFWQTEAFAVDPGPIVEYEVQAVPTSVSAGGLEYLIVFALDAYGNSIDDHSAELTLTDDAGGLDPVNGMGTQACEPFVNGTAFCSAYPWVAASEVVIRATDEAGIWGESNTIEVNAAAPDSVLIDIPTASVAAGEAFDVNVRVIDAYGNTVGFDPAGTDPVTFSDDSGTIACSWVGSVDGTQVFSCSIEGSTDDAAVEARVLGLTGASRDLLLVTNAELAVVELAPLGSSQVAGVPFTLDITGYDAYGNPYITQTDPAIELDDGYDMAPATATLGSAGDVQVSATVYGAGRAVEIEAWQAGVLLGTSRPFVVEAADMHGVSIEVAPWVDIDVAGDVRVAAVDIYDNPITDYAGSITLTSVSGGCDGTTLSMFADGVAEVPITCATPTLGEQLEAVDGSGFVGTSEVFDVVDLACASGPVADLSLDGGSTALECLPSTGGASIEGDGGGSSAGAAGLVTYQFLDGGVRTQRGAQSSTTFTYTSASTHEVQLLVVDADGCADLAEGTIYVGNDDGEPTGPVDLVLSAASVSSTGSLSVDLSASDCTGDVAASQTLLVRSDLGGPAGASTGEGLLITLDAVGEATVTWQFTSGYAGTAALYAGSASGGAYGTASASVTGDVVLPQVVEVTPSGHTSGTVSAIEVTFNEPMYPGNLTGSAVTLAGPSGSVSLGYSLSTDLRTLTLTPASTVDAGAGTWTLTVSSNLRDAAGNRLDGTWSGVQSAFVSTFGDVANTLPSVTSCMADVTRFVPDGDPGVDEEADEVKITPTATSAPRWWWLQVIEVTGERVRSQRTAGTATEVTWDGRGDDGLVVGAGTWSAYVSAVDEHENIGDTCYVEVELGQHVDSP